MDIEILLLLERFREGFGNIFRDFFYQMTTLGNLNFTVLLLASVYWCINKNFGVYMLLGFHWNRLVNGFLKIIVCAYRPWIRDPRLIPDSEVLKEATGYSFPSGHSMNASTFFGGIGIRKDVKKSLRIAAWILVGLISFSRIYFSVHTPQDIIVGPILAILVMFLATKMMTILEKKNADIYVAIFSIIISILIVIYASLKSYPVDYDAEGKILVDGMKMAADTFKGVGWNLGFFVGFIIERRFVKFTTDCDMQTRLTRLIFGLLSYYFVYNTICSLVKTGISGNMGIMLSCALQMIYIVLFFPVFIKISEKRSQTA